MTSADLHISSGRLSTVLEVLSVLGRYGGVLPVASILEMLALRGDMGGVLPSADALRLGNASRVVGTDGDSAHLTAAGISVLHMADEGQVVEARRVLLASLIRHSRRDLLALALMTPKEVEAFGGSEIAQCLRELGLLQEPMTPDVVQWWRSLQIASAQADDDYLKKLGDRAEEMSLRFEQRRLEHVGRGDLSSRVVWVSRFDEGAGYDILSRVGEARDSHQPETPLRIEVKACGRMAEGFRFYFSRNEWDVSRAADTPYVIHLWALADMDSGRETPTAVLSAAQVHAWLPVDNPPTGSWVDCCVRPPESSLTS